MVRRSGRGERGYSAKQGTGHPGWTRPPACNALTGEQYITVLIYCSYVVTRVLRQIKQSVHLLKSHVVQAGLKISGVEDS